MKKLILNVDSLVVDSFDTHEAPSAGLGTVHGHTGNGYCASADPTVCNTMCDWSDAPNISCWQGCGGATEICSVYCSYGEYTCHLDCGPDPE